MIIVTVKFGLINLFKLSTLRVEYRGQYFPFHEFLVNLNSKPNSMTTVTDWSAETPPVSHYGWNIRTLKYGQNQMNNTPAETVKSKSIFPF